MRYCTDVTPLSKFISAMAPSPAAPAAPPSTPSTSTATSPSAPAPSGGGNGPVVFTDLYDAFGKLVTGNPCGDLNGYGT